MTTEKRKVRAGGALENLVVLAVAIATMLLLARAFPLAAARLNMHPWDAEVDWTLARAFLSGQNPYEESVIAEHGLSELGGVGHPPTTGIWFLAFAHLDRSTMAQSLGLAVLFVLALHLLLLARELRAPRPLLSAAFAFALVLSSPWFLNHLEVGQISTPIAFCTVLAWFHLRRGEEVLAGLSLGLATTLKLYPGVLVAFLLVTRRYRAFLAAAVSYLFIAAIVTARYGPSSWLLFFSQQGPIAERWAGHVRNGSLLGILLRLADWECQRVSPMIREMTIVAALAGAVFAAGALWAAGRRRSDPRQLNLCFALTLCVSVFVNPWIWEHYNVLLILPVALVVVELRDARPSLSRSQFGSAAVALGALAAAQALLYFSDFRLRDKLAGIGGGLATREHVRLHILEVASWLPWPVTIGLCALLLRWRSRSAGAAVGEQSPDPR